MVKLTVLALAVLLSAAGDFNYTKGGDDWTGTCADGHRQSPVHISGAMDAPSHFTPLVFDYKATAAGKYSVNLDNGFKLTGLSGTLKTKLIGHEKDQTFYFGEIQVHSPSEHNIEGESFHLELQIYHTDSMNPHPDAAKDVAVVSVMFDEKEGAYNHFLQQVIDAKTEINLNEIFDGDSLNDYYTYQGSLTSPPCTENVDFFIDTEVQYASAGQIEFFKREWEMDPAFAGGRGNNRNIQYGRKADIWHFHAYASGIALAGLLMITTILG